MPFTIPEGFIAEGFSAFDNMNTDHTLRNWIELLPDIFPNNFTLANANPISSRGPIFNLQLNLEAQFSTQAVDPLGAPAGGRKSLFTVTNDDPFDNMIGTVSIVVLLERLI